MTLPIITISREFGSKGREIGEAVAHSLNIEFYDKKIISETAQESGFSPEFIAQNEQKKQHRFFHYLPMTSVYMYEPTTMDKIYIAEHKVISQIGERGPCVIVGRAADYILSSKKNVFNVFIYADLDWRIRNISQEYGIGLIKAKREIKMIDNHRAMYYNTIAFREWGARENYHLMINSCTFGIELCAELICQAAKKYMNTSDLSQQ